MSALRVALVVAALTTVFWQIGALSPSNPRWLDLRWYFVPVYEAFYSAVRAGEPMLWNPYQLCGMPWLGTLQAGFFYPPHVIYLVLPTAWALAASTVFHLALAAGAAAAFARRAGLSAPAAILAGALLVFGGPVRDWQFWPYFLEACAWLPVGALAVLDLADGRTARGALLLAFASGMSWLAGCPQATVLSNYAWASLLLAHLVTSRPRGERLRRGVGGFAIGLALGLALGAITLLPGLELAREGVRRVASVSNDFMYPFGVPAPADVFAAWFATGSPVLLGAALASAPFAIFGHSRVMTLWALAVATLAAAIAAGPATPVFGLYRLLPMLSWFRLPVRVLVLGQLALGILAGLGLDVIAKRLRWRHAAPACVLILLVVAAVRGISTPRPVPPPPYRRNVVVWSHAHLEAYRRLATVADGARVWPFSPGLVPQAPPPKLPTLARLRSIEDYEPLILRRQYEYFVYFGEGATRHTNDRTPFVGRIPPLNSPDGRPAPSTRRRLLDLAAVRFMVLPWQSPLRSDVKQFVRDAGFVSRPALTLDIELVENPQALPRAFITYRTRPAPAAEELLELLARNSFDPLVESWVEGDAGLSSIDGAPARGAPARIVRDDPQVVEIDATLAAPGLVVLADTFYPGWTATVDGAPASILATNHLFRGVPTPAGTHRIRFEYRPRSLALGAGVSLLAALVLAAGARRLKARPAA